VVAVRAKRIPSYVVGFIRGGTRAKFIKKHLRPDGFDAAAFLKACLQAAKRPMQDPEELKLLLKAAGDFGIMIE